MLDALLPPLCLPASAGRGPLMFIAILALVVSVGHVAMAYLMHRYPDGPPWR
ncbi:hypothetical protein [Streptomyces cyaneofuscatus]|uniref:hypothetical protein n=1 Tax=Streptomyces cyaneofuscatus TaxID=66883 RepID=UPI00342C8F09